VRNPKDKKLKPAGFLFLNFAIFFQLLAFSLPAESASDEMNLHDFMEDYTEIAEKKAKKGELKYLERVYKEIPNLALPESKEKWKEITSKALEAKDFKAFKKSCKTCHKEFKKAYKKTYRKRLVTIPADLIQLFKEIQ